MFIALFFACAHISTESPAAGFVREGISLFNAGKIDESAIFFRRAYAADPLFAPAYMWLGRVYLEQGDDYRAEMFFRKSLSLDASRTEIFGWIGDIYWAQNDTTRALEYYSKCPKDNPHYSVLHFRLGMREYQSGNARAARAEFEKALAHPDFWGAHFGLGLIAFSDGEFEKATVFFHQADRLCAEPEVKYWLGKSYRMRGRSAEAYFYFTRYANSGCHEGDELCPQAVEHAEELKDAVLGPECEPDTMLVIPFKVKEQDVVDVGVFDTDGNLVKSLFTGWITKGEYTLTWNGMNADGEPVENGLYLGCIEREFDISLLPMLLNK